MHIVQEAQRLHTLMEFVAQGVGVAIIPDPFCRPAGVVFRKLEDLDLAANLQLVWLASKRIRPVKRIYRSCTPDCTQVSACLQ